MLKILKLLAYLTIWRFKPEIIAVAGPAGKSSVKEAIFAVLKNHYRARKESDEFNGELGVVLAILGKWQKIGRPLFLFWLRVIISSIFRIIFSPKSLYPKILILSSDEFRPKISVLTAVADGAAEFPQSCDFAILSFDDAAVVKIKRRIKNYGKIYDEESDMKIINLENRIDGNGLSGVSFKIEYGGGFVPVVLRKVLGKSHAQAAAAAVAVGLIHNLNLVESSELIAANYSPLKGEMSLTDGIKNTYIIDDSRGASPVSMRLALETIRELKASRKIAVLGDILETGKFSVETHEAAGRLAAESVDVLLTVGPRGKFIAEAALNAGMEKNKVLSFDIYEEAAELLKTLIRKEDLILIKASRAVGLEKIADELTAHSSSGKDA